MLGRELELIELDGKTDPATVGNAARQLIEQGADVMIAPCDFDIGGPASQAAQSSLSAASDAVSPSVSGHCLNWRATMS